MQALHVGIGFELEVRGRTADVERAMFEHVVEQSVLADELGYASVWFVEHHFTRGFSHCSAPETMLAALSRITRRIRLGHGVVLLPFEHPVRVAERVATLDVLSGGRVEFGTGRGASPTEYQAFGRPFEQSREIWEEHLDAVLTIWNADTAPVTMEGRYFSVPDVSVLPRPVQRPHPPVWVASTSLDGFRAAARRGWNLLCMPILKGIDGLAEDVAEYRRTLEEHGHDPAERRVAMLIPWHVAPTTDAALEAADALVWYVRRQVNLVTPPGYKDAGHAEYRLLGQLAAGKPPEEALQDLVDHTMVFVGDVDTARKHVQRVVDAGATDLLCQFQVGGLDHERVVGAMRLFAAEVHDPASGAAEPGDAR
jgi:natural product biosynthesis luciferase-like monooxygenase protein